MSAKPQARLSVQTFFPLIAAAYLSYVSLTGDDRAMWLRWVYGAVSVVLVVGVVATAVNQKRAVSRARDGEAAQGGEAAQPLEGRRDLP
ncbi:hypothetical protein [Streptomyces sp. TRM64462]|uniref:hypothetical protein n=1 Tax=Streptomyces sp. TRM64462 TaxID=2741726 RepID=UPI001585D3E5|nr:hypothetical protein [Streptomyces sp. TRM64462]